MRGRSAKSAGRSGIYSLVKGNERKETGDMSVKGVRSDVEGKKGFIA